MTEARTEPKGVMNRRRGTGVRYRTRADVEKEALFCARGNRHFCTFSLEGHITDYIF